MSVAQIVAGAAVTVAGLAAVTVALVTHNLGQAAFAAIVAGALGIVVPSPLGRADR